MADIAAVHLLLQTITPIPVKPWSGVLLAKILRDHGIQCIHSLTPLIDPTGTPIPTGTGRIHVVREGTILQARITIRKQECPNPLEAAKRIEEALTAHGLETQEITITEPRPQQATASQGELLFRIHYNPTIYTFHAHLVPYPSPTRLLLALAKLAWEAWGIDARRQAEAALADTELIAYKTRVVELDIGKARKTKAITGTATYLARTPAAAKLLQALLPLTQHANIGKSRGIGFGHIITQPGDNENKHHP